MKRPATTSKRARRALPEGRRGLRHDERRGLRHDDRGAVLVEFLVAVMPLLITFSCFVQLSQIASARLVLKHATIIGVRAAAVISNGRANTPDQPRGNNRAVIQQAVDAGLGPWRRTMTRVDVEIEDNSSCSDPYGLISVTVHADYRCSVPLAGRLLCGARGATHPFRQRYSYPHQGALYKDGGGAECGGFGAGGLP